MDLKKFTNDILKKILTELKKKENTTRIHSQLVDPLIAYAFKKINPYIITLFSIIILSFIIIIFILLFIIRLYFYKNSID